MVPQPELTDGRVLLRPWAPTDAPSVAAACADADIARWTSLPSPYTPADAREFVAEWAPGQWSSGEGAVYAVVDPVTGQLYGSCGLHLGRDQATAHLGYWTAPAARGRGLTTAAVRLLCDWTFRDRGLTRVEWYAEVGNWASRRVAEKAGFTVEGLLRSRLRHRGQWVDSWVGARLATDSGHPRQDGVRQPVLHAGRVTLRPFELADAPAVRAACADPVTQAWLPLPAPYTIDDAHRWVTVGAFAERHAGTGVEYAVAANAGGALVGDVGLKRLDRTVGSAEVGYWTVPGARGRGYMTEAVTTLCRWAFADLSLRRVQLLAAPGNLASQRVAEKAGFSREGLLRAAGYVHAGPVDLISFSRLRDDPEVCGPSSPQASSRMTP